MKRVVRITPDILIGLQENKPYQIRTYIDKARFVPNMYWGRFERMIELVENYHPKRVLDLGCGSGVFLPTLSKMYSEVHAADLDISVARKISNIYNIRNVYLYEKDLFSCKFDEGFFDIIFSASVLEHFINQDALFSELRRILSPGGFLVFSSPTETLFYQLGRAVFRYTKPADHYYSVFKIAEHASKYLEFVNLRGWPFSSLFLKYFSAYMVYVFRNSLKSRKVS